MADQTSKTRRKVTRHKGENTRHRILEAALHVIAREGVRGTTHRAVARQADVPLSLTTYYFKNRQELVADAFRMFMERDREDKSERWARVMHYLERKQADALDTANGRRIVIDYLTRNVVEHVREKLTYTPEGLAVEYQFIFEALTDDELKALSRKHLRRLMEPLLQFCQFFNQRDPKSDAELLLGAITRLEYESLYLDPDDVDYRRIRRLVRRIISWIVAPTNG